jgi:hypothetical protein
VTRWRIAGLLFSARGVWQSEELLRSRFASAQFGAALATAGFPPMESADISVLRLHAIEPPL